MTEIELIGVPFDGYGRAGHQARAAQALREAGLRASIAEHQVVDSENLALPAGDPTRGPETSLINEAALLAMTEQVGLRVKDAVIAGHFPLVYGADCTTLLRTVRWVGPTGIEPVTRGLKGRSMVDLTMLNIVENRE